MKQCHEMGIEVAFPLVLKEKSIMILILVLFVNVGCGHIPFALSQGPIVEPSLGQRGTPLSCVFGTTAFPSNRSIAYLSERVANLEMLTH